jgi:hypothetical protein
MARAGAIIGVAGILLMLVLAQWYWPAVLP